MATADSAHSARPVRQIVLGRVVNLTAMRAEHTLGPKPPDWEYTDSGADLGVTFALDGAIEAFELSTGERRWSATPEAPCALGAFSRSHVFGLCGDQVVAYRTTDGARTVVDQGPLEDALLGGDLLATLRADGQVRLFDAETLAMRSSERIPALTRGMAQDSALVASPSIEGLCYVNLKLKGFGATEWAYDVGCYDARLLPIWTRTLSAKSLQANARYRVRQQGPYRLVLDDQPDDPGEPAAAGRSVVVRWTDGHVEARDDYTFATLEDERGQMVSPAAARKLLERAMHAAPGQEAFSRNEARAVAAAGRVFALVRRGDSSTLGGLDLSTGQVLFLVPVGLGAGAWTLEVVEGWPVVRSSALAQRWRVSIHDPQTGRVLYEDVR